MGRGYLQRGRGRFVLLTPREEEAHKTPCTCSNNDTAVPRGLAQLPTELLEALLRVCPATGCLLSNGQPKDDHVCNDLMPCFENSVLLP